MQKQINDYLHLYIGATCKSINKHGAYCFVPITHILLAENNPITEGGKIEPLLRPESDMNEAEMQELERLSNMECESASCLDVFAAMINQCRKWEIDVDGLIKAGLAIDKTKL